MASHRYTHAVVCRIPLSFKTKALGISEEIDFDKAKQQHEEYCKVLRDTGLDVIELPPDENLPNCIFVEDTAVVCNGTVLICRPVHAARQKELVFVTCWRKISTTNSTLSTCGRKMSIENLTLLGRSREHQIKPVEIIRMIMKRELELPVIEIADPSATIEGGDVLFTGREFFVGLSNCTNEAGARALAAAFPEYPVTPIKIGHTLHIKSLVSVAGPDILCVSEGKESKSVLKRIEQEASFRYQTITVPDDNAANCVYVNGTLIYSAEFPESVKVFEERVDYNKVSVNVSELRKAYGALTCCSILIKKTKYLKKL